MVKFAEFTLEEERAVHRIIDRFQKALIETQGVSAPPVDRMSFRMDIAAVHASNPLDLKALADAPDFDFAHDICGICDNLNRETGELENCFLPRYSVPKSELKEASQ